MPNDFGNPQMLLLAAAALVGLVFLFIFALVVFSYGKLWLQAFVSNAHVSIFSLVGMSLRQVHARTIVEAKIMAMQAGVGTDPHTGITTQRLEAHYLAGGNVPRSHPRDDRRPPSRIIDLDFERATAIDLAGRNMLEAVQTSVNPKVIDCPDPKNSKRPRSTPSPRTACSSK